MQTETTQLNVQKINRRICIAPMMDYTDRFDRYFLRLISRHVVLYTEMVTTHAVLRGDAQRLLKYDPLEHPVSLQLGGSDAKQLAESSRIGEALGYDEINLNVGCPSERVSSGRFGASLMLEPNLVAECVSAMNHAVKIPVTVKCRIGVDDFDRYEDLVRFVDTVARANCQVFIVHARKAWLKGLSPKQNREVPPLRYHDVYQLKREFPHLEIIINGGISTYDQIDAHLRQVDGVMIGREAYHNPYLLSEIDRRYFDGASPIPSYDHILAQLEKYITTEMSNGASLHSITRHILGLFHGRPGARRWRRYLSEHAPKSSAGIDVVREAFRQTQLIE